MVATCRKFDSKSLSTRHYNLHYIEREAWVVVVVVPVIVVGRQLRHRSSSGAISATLTANEIASVHGLVDSHGHSDRHGGCHTWSH